MMLLVFCKNTEVDRIRQVQSYHMGLGLLGYMGNKGGVGIRMRIDETSIVFVNSHLVHEEGNASKRNYQFQELIKRMEFKGELKDVNLDATKTSMDSDDRKGSVGGQRQQLQQEKEIMEVKKIFDSSYVFWFGDLNYRIEAPTNIINNLLGTGNYKLLLGLDQLYISREKRLAFEMFTEEEIKFLPTYRYIQGTANFDPKRNPAWCDRILYWKNPKLSGGSSNPVSANISRNTSGNLSIGASGNASGNTSGNISRNASAIFKGDNGENASRNTGGDASDKSVDKQQLGAANATQQMSVQQSEQVTEPAVTMAVEPRSVSSPGPSVFTGLSSGPVLRTEGVEVGPEPGGRVSGSDNSSTGYNTSVNKGGVIKCYEYNSEPSQNTSDHKPVFGIFEIDTVGFSPEKYSQVYSTILEEMNIKENATSLPNTEKPGAGSGSGGGSDRITDNNGICNDSQIWVNPVKGVVLPGSQVEIEAIIYKTKGESEGEKIVLSIADSSLVQNEGDRSSGSGSGADTDVSKKQETKEIQQQKDEAIAPAGDSESPQASSTAAKQETSSNPSIIENGNSVVEAKDPINTDIPGGGSGSDSSGSSDSSDSGNTSVINEKSTESKEDSIDEDDYLVYYEKAVKPNTDHNKNNDTSGSNDVSGRHDEILVLRIVGGRDIFIVVSYEL
ncbi:Inositol polyphosphate 5-phosphatase OCRL-1 [Zancudomyces culisetae]|uniref:Inositol polyphosphate 5-phosphatase OCRL-1 n=1 Tax=Zancudomyces culisetae TaxID=1213189 RepID=A0A1R1PYD8_ZANCU|nr:Inositol polyphosphate 5-phosphatase OCRL-1 [Zancudomyces culisetae]|eukprot:OMH85971.1 Inositol polyphosphate 5-phosphatase OCRL-1 [Zancudomyces culisetae]